MIVLTVLWTVVKILLLILLALLLLLIFLLSLKVGIEIKYDQGIQYVHVSDSLFELTKLGEDASSTAFEKLIENGEVEKIVNKYINAD